MTRLSDSLRGAADRAPIGDVTVSTSAASRRIYRGRRLRAAANATAGAAWLPSSRSPRSTQGWAPPT